MLLSPFAVNRLLTYLESNGEDAIVRPWVWILLLFVDPMGRVIGFEYYVFTMVCAPTNASKIYTTLRGERSTDTFNAVWRVMWHRALWLHASKP